MTDTIEIFISYDDKDEALLKTLKSQLAPLEGTYPVTIWDKGAVTPGQEKQRVIDEHLKAARIILLLVSPNYLASKYLYGHEVKRAMEYHAAGTAKVVPVLLSPVHWEGTLFGKLRPLPANERPVSRWNDKSDAFYAIAEGVRGMIEQLVGPPQEETPSTAVAAEKSPPKEAAMDSRPTTQEQITFDVFLCHNSQDKPAVKEIAEQLIARGIKPWLDEWELRPGFPWQRVLEKQITQIKTAAVFVGSSGMGPWHQMELEAFLREFVRRECPVILVLLKNAPQEPDVPTFLGGMTRVDFRKQIPNPMEHLVWGITGENPHYKNARGSQQPQSQVPASPLSATPMLPEKRQPLEDSAATSRGTTTTEEIEVFLVHAPGNKNTSKWIEKHIAEPLEDTHKIRVWYDEWDLIPGTSEGPSRAENLRRAKSCAVCISDDTSPGWYLMEIESANHRRMQDPTFRIIPVLLPDVTSAKVNELQSLEALKKYHLELNVPVDFRDKGEEEALYLLACGIRGIRPGRWRAGKTSPVPPPPAT